MYRINVLFILPHPFYGSARLRARSRHNPCDASQRRAFLRAPGALCAYAAFAAAALPLSAGAAQPAASPPPLPSAVSTGPLSALETAPAQRRPGLMSCGELGAEVQGITVTAKLCKKRNVNT